MATGTGYTIKSFLLNPYRRTGNIAGTKCSNKKNPHYCGLNNLIPGVDLTPD
jgi:hypothetical protein